MSPEQVRRPKSVDARSDIWSLGIILHELLAGRPPFPADAPMSVLAAVVSEPPESLRLLRPDLPEELYGIIARCLEKDPRDRYQAVLDLVEAFTKCSPHVATKAHVRISAIVESVKRRGRRQAEGAAVSVEASTLASPRDLPAVREPSSRDDSGVERTFLPRPWWRRPVALVGVALTTAAALFIARRSPEVRTEVRVLRENPTSPPTQMVPARDPAATRDPALPPVVRDEPKTAPPPSATAAPERPAAAVETRPIRAKAIVRGPLKALSETPTPSASMETPPPARVAPDPLEGRH
jgi:hypothetical protein